MFRVLAARAQLRTIHHRDSAQFVLPQQFSDVRALRAGADDLVHKRVVVWVVTKLRNAERQRAGIVVTRILMPMGATQ